MPWVRISRPFDFRANRNSAIAYKAGEYLVSEKCKKAVLAAGAGEAIEDPTEARKKRKNAR